MTDLDALLLVNTMEYDDGNRDVWNSNYSSSIDHLIVMVNGTGGSAKDWMFATEQFVQVFPDKVFVHRSKQNVDKLAKDGVDVMGERLAREVIEVIQRNPNMRKISFIAYSVGGLVARYAIGLLYRTPENEPMQNSRNAESNADSVGTICGLQAMNFITLATPHLGLSGHKQFPFLMGKTKLERIARKIAPWTDGKTGGHLFLTDGAEQTHPLLLSMVTDSNECYFMSALRAFKCRVVYANVINDRTASIRVDSIRRQWDGIRNEKYPHIVYEEDCQACDIVGDNSSYSIPEEMVKGLSSVAWEKVDVSFNRGSIKLEAHSLIQVANPSRHIEGADVIQHIIDHFHT
ncbi:hypothetical protein P8452_49143 [Trifolium repens]|nr:hypothetical protein P8452_49142 [Trifolium repens]WJX64348.1 hypothetical protein P8452_49143 [Trifolium repens]